MTHAQEAAIARVCAHECLQRDLVEALESIFQYGADTLSGRAEGLPDDRAWQRAAVAEMTKRARAALAKAKEHAA